MTASRPLPEHGTTARFARGCRCEPCVHARRLYNKHGRVRRERGIRGLTDARPVAQHIARLRDAGASLQAIATAAGCSQGTVLRIEHGAPTVFASVAAGILAVKPLRPSKVPPVGAARRLGALFALGWPLTAISAETGLARTHVSTIANGRRAAIATATDEAVRAAYERLSGRPGPSGYSRAWAARRGWAPPLAWEGVDIDDPAAVPDSGALSPRPLALAEDVEFIRRTTGVTDLGLIADRLQLTRESLDRALGRARALRRAQREQVAA